jgi:hypothetical protein
MIFTGYHEGGAAGVLFDTQAKGDALHKARFTRAQVAGKQVDVTSRGQLSDMRT